MTEEDNVDYKSTLKNTVAFGGLQFINILISIVKGKFLAVFLGPIGLGINNVLLNSLNMITTANDLGLDLSAVRSISENLDNENKVIRTVTIVRKLFLWTGILGALFTILFSSFLSFWTFGTYDYTWSFVFLSLYVLFTTITKSQQTILRGIRKIDYILKSGLIGSIAGLVISIPLFYFYGEKGIVPTLILTSFVIYITSLYFFKKVNLQNIKVKNSEVIAESKSMVKLGIMLMISIFIGMTVKYLISIGIGRIGNFKDVGLYTAATSISGQYIGFILAALGADYFPRLAAAHTNVNKLNKVVNDQAEVVLLLATPILIIMIITAPLMIRVILTKEFMPIVSFIRFIALGSFFQLFSYCLGYISFAKNDKRTYLFLEAGFGASLHLVATLVCYYIWGIDGFGYGFVIIYVIYTLVISVITFKLYQFRVFKETLKFFTVNFAFILSTFLLFLIWNNVISYLLGTVILFANIAYSYKQLNKKLNILEFVRSKLKKR
ncbi:oligosaccharide flippase family protein [Flavobacterium sp. GSB-24]|uniref:oligosaccharide flippase family protein n=1 Tax=Flavobacterium sp. GSB-24 TaxID=2994319 RepID=UPI002492557F|nr:oligosaccharide flippase family protein [Flavobacterium sp. GSB-24]BDU23581.1 O-antigen translocase [Flavobacterium sp. GSB-24]